MRHFPILYLLLLLLLYIYIYFFFVGGGGLNYILYDCNLEKE